MAGRKNLSNPRSPVREFDEDDYADEVEEEEEEIEIDNEDDSHVSNESSHGKTPSYSTISSGDLSVESMTKELEELKSPSHSSQENFTPRPFNNKNNNNNAINGNSSSSNNSKSVEEGELPSTHSTSGVGVFSGRAVRIPLRSITRDVEEEEGEQNKSKDLVPANDRGQRGSNSDWEEKTRDWFKRNVSMSSSSSASSVHPTFTLTSGAKDLPIVGSNLSLHHPDRQAELPSSSSIQQQQQQQTGPLSNNSDAENLTPPPPHHHRPFYFPSNSSDMVLNQEEHRNEGRLIGGHNTYQTIVKKKKVTSSVRVSDPFGLNYAYEKTSYKSKVTKLAPFSRSSPTPPPPSPISNNNSDILLFKEPKVPMRETRKRRTITGESAGTSTSKTAIQGSNNTCSENQNELNRRDEATSKANNNVTNSSNTNFRGQRGTRRLPTMASGSDFQPCRKKSKPSDVNDSFKVFELDSSSSCSSSSSSDIPLGGSAKSYDPEVRSKSLRELKPRLGRSMKRKGYFTSTPASRGFGRRFHRRPTPHPPSFRRKLQFDQDVSGNNTINEEPTTPPASEPEGNENIQSDSNNDNNNADDEGTELSSDSERDKDN